MRTAGFKFIDLPTAAERLGITRNDLLRLVSDGRIRPFSGSGQQSVFRATDVERLASEMAAGPAPETAAAETAPGEGPVTTPTTPEHAATVRTRRRDAIKLIGTRLSMDSRWAEITDKDIATWLDALDPVQFERVRKVSGLAIERLQHVLAMLDEHEQRLAATRKE
ncbi:MAG: helix-turn-helix transcriptional regulator [Chloroflexia bacterium]